MTPDDPRHGTYAGYIAHRRDDEDACDACALENRRETKRAKLRIAAGVRNRIPLGDRALRVLNTRSIRAISKATGLAENNLYQTRNAGADKVVLRSTRDAILAAGAKIPTSVGVQRRLQALAALGYTMRELAPMIGAHEEPLVRMMRRTTPPEYVNAHVVEGVLRTYDRLYMTVPPRNRVSSRARTIAAGRGWVTPLAWDDIDNPGEDPTLATFEEIRYAKWWTSRGYTDYDEAHVHKLLNGVRVPESTRAEREEAMRRWMSTGRSEKSLCDIHGWHDSRYAPRAREAAAS
jgi:hypothetical protein